MVKRGLLTFLFMSWVFCLLPLCTKGQGISTLRVGSCQIDSVAIKLDSLSILPETFSLSGIESADYQIDFITATISILDTAVLGKTIHYIYRVFSIDLAQRHKHKNANMIMTKRTGSPSNIIPISNYSELTKEDLSIINSGTIARGFSVGNNQDFVLSSTLNLQLAGMLANGLEIQASITDKNVPIQPEGNTQMIQDFDKIFIQLNYLDKLRINAGDIDIVSPHSYFMVVNKRILGVDFFSTQKINDKYKLNNQIGGGVNKGKFTRQTLAIINGVQGPYKLSGSNNELNIVILSGSERVYLDGKLLTRGQENDYIIDYNNGELTFTSKTLITTEKRVIVEFEYRSDYYAHYTLYTYNEFTHEKNNKLRINVNFLHDQDAKNRSIQPELDNDQKSFLSQLGDDLGKAFYPQADTASFNSNEILYIKQDTIIDGVSYSPVYVRSTDASQELFRLSFTLMGEHKGNYILQQSTANGRVFQWVAPVNGIPQGNYEPVTLLSTPKLMQMGTVAAAYSFQQGTTIQTEFAFSNYDENTFSKKDDQDNVGFAVKLLLGHEQKLRTKKKNVKPWLFKNQLNYEFTHKDFHQIESYREVEFARNYNLVEDYSPRRAEQMLHFRSNLNHAEIGDITYNFNLYSRMQELNAYRNELTAAIQKNGFKYRTNNAFLLNNDSVRNSNFIKSDQWLSKSFRKIEIGITDLLEYNIFKDRKQDTLLGNSYAFNEAGVFLKNNDSLPYIYNVSFLNRINYQTWDKQLLLQSINNEGKVSFEMAKLKNNRIRGTATYRNSQVKDSTEQYNSEHFFIGSIEYSGRFFKNTIVLTTYYEAGSGMEQKKTFSYLKVADGQGTHTWNDYNRNGIEELEEFEIAAFQDEANYIKIWISTPEYINTYNNRFTQSIQLRPGNIWSGKKGFLKLLSRFANIATFQAEQKNTHHNRFAALNPFQFNIADSLLVSSNLNFVNSLSFNQTSPYFGIDYITRATQTKNLLYYGFEQNKMTVHEIILRGNPRQDLTLKTNYSYQVKGNQSDYLVDKNYKLNTHSIDNAILFTFKNMLFATFNYIYKQKKNILGTEAAICHQFNLDISVKLAKRGSLNTNFQFVNIAYNAQSKSSISYEMLEGLNKGNNAIWMLGYQVNITEYLQLELMYHGRASQGNRVIHTGNLQLRASF